MPGHVKKLSSYIIRYCVKTIYANFFSSKLNSGHKCRETLEIMQTIMKHAVNSAWRMTEYTFASHKPR